MNGIVITPKGEIYHREFQKPLHRSTGEVVGGFIEHVRTRRLGKPYCMIVNEDFINLGLPINPVGSYLYETETHGHPICGNIIIMKEFEDDYADLTPDEISWLENYFQFIYNSVK